jgi:hypothetical protein
VGTRSLALQPASAGLPDLRCLLDLSVMVAPPVLSLCRTVGAVGVNLHRATKATRCTNGVAYASAYAHAWCIHDIVVAAAATAVVAPDLCVTPNELTVQRAVSDP